MVIYFVYAVAQPVVCEQGYICINEVKNMSSFDDIINSSSSAIFA